MSSIEKIRKARRVVIKVGTSTLTYHTGRMNLRRIETLVRVISDLCAFHVGVSFRIGSLFKETRCQQIVQRVRICTEFGKSVRAERVSSG